MTRIQSGYNPQAELTQVTASPNIETAHAGMDVRGNSAFQLAEALGVAMPAAQDAAKTYISTEENKARRDANGLTVEELNKRVNDGELMQSQSPTYVASLQHIYGENSLKKLQQDASTAMTTGQLKFNSNEELDAYLTGKRNEVLKGQSRFTVAGFDKEWNQFRDGALANHSKLLNDQIVQRGSEEAAQSLSNTVQEFQKADYQGTPQEAAKAIMGKFQQLSRSSLLLDGQKKDALHGVATEIAASGNTELLNELLHQDVKDGINVHGMLGPKVVTQLAQHVQVVADKNLRDEWDVARGPFVKMANDGTLEGEARDEFLRVANSKYQRATTPEAIQALIDRSDAVSIQQAKEAEKAQAKFEAMRSKANAEQTIRTQVEAGTFAGGGAKVTWTDEHGNTREVDSKDIAQQYLKSQEGKLDFPQLVNKYNANGVTNPEWLGVIATGADNLNTVGLVGSDKKLVTMTPQGQKAVDMYMQMWRVSPEAAAKHAGSNDKLFSQIALLTTGRLNLDINEAVSLINQGNHSGVTQAAAEKAVAKVPSMSEKLISPHMWSPLTNWVGGLFSNGPGNKITNSMEIDSDFKTLAEVLVKSGRYDAAGAQEVLVKQFSDPQVTTVINGSIYQNKNLPVFPEHADRKELMESFIKEVPGAVSNARHFPDAVRLHPEANGTYKAMAGNIPLQDEHGQFLVYSKEDIQKWGTDRYYANNRKKAEDRDYEAFKSRVGDEYNNLTGYKAEQYGQPATFNKRVLSREAYDKFKAQGVNTAPVEKLMELTHPKNDPKPAPYYPPHFKQPKGKK